MNIWFVIFIGNIYPESSITVYADMSDDDCNSLDFALGHTGVGATIPTRSFSIKVYITGLIGLRYHNHEFPLFKMNILLLTLLLKTLLGNPNSLRFEFESSTGMYPMVFWCNDEHSKNVQL